MSDLPVTNVDDGDALPAPVSKQRSRKHRSTRKTKEASSEPGADDASAAAPAAPAESEPPTATFDDEANVADMLKGDDDGGAGGEGGSGGDQQQELKKKLVKRQAQIEAKLSKRQEEVALLQAALDKTVSRLAKATNSTDADAAEQLDKLTKRQEQINEKLTKRQDDITLLTTALDKTIRKAAKLEALIAAAGTTDRPATPKKATFDTAPVASVPPASSSTTSSAASNQPSAPVISSVGMNFDDDDTDAVKPEGSDAHAEREAEAHLDQMASRVSSEAAQRERDLREAEEAREAKRREQKRQAQLEAKLALEKASKEEARAAELKKQEEIAALRAAREAERRRKEEEQERAEQEREEQREREWLAEIKKEKEAKEKRERERERELRERDGTAVVSITPIIPFNDGTSSSSSKRENKSSKPTNLNTNLKWNRPPEDSPVILTDVTPISPNNKSTYPPASPVINSRQPPPYSPQAQSTSTAVTTFGEASPSHSQQQAQLTAQQLAHARQLEQQRSEEARALAEKKDKIMQAGLQIDQAKKFTKVAFWGEVFLKHCRRGAPHERNVTLEVTGSELKFDWSSGQLKAHKNDIQLVEGKGTPVFQRPTAEKTKPERCFSIVTANRTLDLEAPNDQARDYWVNGIKLLLKYLK